MGSKRTLETDKGAPSSKSAKTAVSMLVNPDRWRVIKSGDVGEGPVLYWMNRDQRMRDNWALLHAAEVAIAKNTRLAVCFNFMDSLAVEGARQFVFSLRGLRLLAPELEAANIRFYLLRGEPSSTIPELVSKIGAGLLVVDMMPLRAQQESNKQVAKAVDCPVHEVDAHNIVPVWIASDKKEHAARTIRPKIHKLLPRYLEEFPEFPTLQKWEDPPAEIDWDTVISDVRQKGKSVPELTMYKPGEAAGKEALCGPTGFLSQARLKKYDTERNNPTKPQLSVHRAALEVRKHRSTAPGAVDTFLEESVIRRELSDNFTFYEPNYDNVKCAAGWALETLKEHESDKREHLYSREQMERSKTHDDLWNAAQRELVHLGKMHGYLRMYWAKKILEWTRNAEEAIEIGLYLNDKYSIDGRDPNGFVGIMWSMVGIHDRGWTEREIFGKIRYMNYNGCKRKFDIKGYIAGVENRIRLERKAAAVRTE